MIALTVALSVLGARFNSGRWDDPLRWGTLAATGVILVVVLGITGSLGTAPAPVLQPGQVPFAWAPYLGLVVFALLLMAAIGLTTPNGIFFASAVTVVTATLFGLLRQGALLGLTHPTTWWFWMPVALNFIYILLAWITLPNGANVAMTVLATELGVSFYIYMPIVSDLRNPPAYSKPVKAASLTPAGPASLLQASIRAESSPSVKALPAGSRSPLTGRTSRIR